MGRDCKIDDGVHQGL